MLTKLAIKLQTKKMELADNDEGATVIEYALLAAFISIIAIVAIKAVGVDVNDLFTDVDTELG